MKHAPRGPIKAKGEADPIRGTDPIRCRAKAKHSGAPCKYPAIPGGHVCRFHGGGAPQVKLAALERLRALQDKAISRLEHLIDQDAFPSTAYAASRDVLDRTLGKPAESVAVEHSGEVAFRWADE